MQKITPFLWFDGEAEEATNFYTTIFQNSKIGNIFRQGDKALTVAFTLDGQQFTALNGGPAFKINPSISFYVTCETMAETEEVWQQLAAGGTVLMPLEKYPWSEKYGWVVDQYGLSWQISFGKLEDVGHQKFTPSLLFTGAHFGQAEAALELYTSTFANSSVNGILRYGAGENGPEGTVMHAQFTLNGDTFMVMDDPLQQQEYTFNEAISFVVNCENQSEVDYFWEKFTTNGGQESQCGWLKDPFGVSWQIVPMQLPKLLADPDPARAQRTMSAMMQMKKIDIEKLHQAANDDSKTVITVQATVNAPISMVWDYWSAPKHIMQWNSASPEWHTPRAENDLRKGGSFNSRMEAKDGSFGFDFGGTYDEVIDNQLIEYTLSDGRKVIIRFSELENGTHVTESFEAEKQNSLEMQQTGWQAILDNFKDYVEGKV